MFHGGQQPQGGKQKKRETRKGSPCGDLNGKEIQKRGDICIRIADSLCYTVETNTAL